MLLDVVGPEAIAASVQLSAVQAIAPLTVIVNLIVILVGALNGHQQRHAH